MKKTLVGLFSKGKSASKPPEKDAGKSGEQKKKFKFRSLSRSSLTRSTTSVADLPPRDEISNSDFTENEPHPSQYATMPSAKSKSFSFSEMDLRKPKSLRNYSFGFRKKLKKDDNKFSKSTIGLPGMAAQHEENLDSSQTNMDHVNTNLSSSQPMLHTANKTRSHRHSAFSLNQQQTSNSLLMQQQSQEILVFDSSEMLDVQKAPIATISELEDIAEPWRKSYPVRGGTSHDASRRSLTEISSVNMTEDEESSCGSIPDLHNAALASLPASSTQHKSPEITKENVKVSGSDSHSGKQGAVNNGSSRQENSTVPSSCDGMISQTRHRDSVDHTVGSGEASPSKTSDLIIKSTVLQPEETLYRPKKREFSTTPLSYTQPDTFDTVMDSELSNKTNDSRGESTYEHSYRMFHNPKAAESLSQKWSDDQSKPNNSTKDKSESDPLKENSYNYPTTSRGFSRTSLSRPKYDTFDTKGSSKAPKAKSAAALLSGIYDSKAQSDPRDPSSPVSIKGSSGVFCEDSGRSGAQHSASPVSEYSSCGSIPDLHNAALASLPASSTQHESPEITKENVKVSGSDSHSGKQGAVNNGSSRQENSTVPSSCDDMISQTRHRDSVDHTVGSDEASPSKTSGLMIKSTVLQPEETLYRPKKREFSTTPLSYTQPDTFDTVVDSGLSNKTNDSRGQSTYERSYRMFNNPKAAESLSQKWSDDQSKPNNSTKDKSESDPLKENSYNYPTTSRGFSRTLSRPKYDTFDTKGSSKAPKAKSAAALLSSSYDSKAQSDPRDPSSPVSIKASSGVFCEDSGRSGAQHSASPVSEYSSCGSIPDLHNAALASLPASSTQHESPEVTKENVKVSGSDSHSGKQGAVNNGSSRQENSTVPSSCDDMISQTRHRDSVDHTVGSGEASPSKTSDLIIKSTVLQPEETLHHPKKREFSTTPLSYTQPDTFDTVMDSELSNKTNDSRGQSTYERSYESFNNPKAAESLSQKWSDSFDSADRSRPNNSTRDKSESDPFKVNSYTYPTTSRGFPRTPFSHPNYDTFDLIGSNNAPKAKSAAALLSSSYSSKAQSDPRDPSSPVSIKASSGVFCEDSGRSGAQHSASPVSEYSSCGSIPDLHNAALASLPASSTQHEPPEITKENVKVSGSDSHSGKQGVVNNGSSGIVQQENSTVPSSSDDMISQTRHRDSVDHNNRIVGLGEAFPSKTSGLMIKSTVLQPEETLYRPKKREFSTTPLSYTQPDTFDTVMDSELSNKTNDSRGESTYERSYRMFNNPKAAESLSQKWSDDQSKPNNSTKDESESDPLKENSYNYPTTSRVLSRTSLSRPKYDTFDTKGSSIAPKAKSAAALLSGIYDSKAQSDPRDPSSPVSIKGSSGVFCEDSGRSGAQHSASPVSEYSSCGSIPDLHNAALASLPASSTQHESPEITKENVKVSGSDSHSGKQGAVNNGSSRQVNSTVPSSCDDMISQTRHRDSVDHTVGSGEASPSKTSDLIIKSTVLQPEETLYRPKKREFSTTPLSYTQPDTFDTVMDSELSNKTNDSRGESTYERSYRMFNNPKAAESLSQKWSDDQSKPNNSTKDESESDPLKENSYNYPTTSRGFSRTPLSRPKYNTSDILGSNNAPKDKSAAILSSGIYDSKSQSDPQDQSSPVSIKGSSGVFCEDSGAQHSAPPVSEYSTSHGTETRVSPPKQRATVVKESVSDRASMDSGLPSDASSLISLPDKMTGIRDFDVKSDTSDTESFYSFCPLPEEKEELKGETSRSEEAYSPLFLSAGSDEGSILDVYYSADEDNIDGHLDTYASHSREDPKDPPPTGSTAETASDQGDHHSYSYLGTKISQIPPSAERVKPEVKVKQEEETREQEVPAGLVQPGNTLLVCDSPPPSEKPHVLDRNNIKKEDLIEPTFKFDSLIKYYESNSAQSSPARKPYVKRDVKARETDEDGAVVTVVKFVFTSPPAEVLTVTHSTELQSDATVSADNRAAPRSSKWEDTITHDSDTNRTTREQAVVTPSDPHEKTAVVPEDPISAGFASAADEGLTAKSKVHNMSSAYSSLSTTLSVKALTHSKEDEPKHRVRKVSLVSNTEDESKDTVSKEYRSAEMSSDYKWETTFDNVKAYTSDNYSDSSADCGTSVPSSCQVNPEATAYRLSDRLDSHSSHEGLSEGEPRDEWRRSFVWQEESAAPAGEIALQKEGETERERFSRSSQDDFNVSTSFTDHPREDGDETSFYSGVFKAQFVDLEDPAASGPSSPVPPDPESSEMESLVDTLKNMGPSQRLRSINQRVSPHGLVTSLSPIVEDSPGNAASDHAYSGLKHQSPVSESLNGIYNLPPGIGLKRTNLRDSTSPLAMLKQNQGSTGHNVSPLRSPTTNSENINGNVMFPPPNPPSRLENSLVFGSFRSSSVDQKGENTHRPFFRARSLPDYGNERLSVVQDVGDSGPGMDSVGSRFERISFLSNSLSGSLNGSEEHSSRMSRPPPLTISSSPTSNSPGRMLSPTSSIELQRPFSASDFSLPVFNQTPGMGMGVATSPVGPPLLQRSFSHEGIGTIQQNSTFNSMQGEPQTTKAETEKSILAKYRAFPDAYLTKEKEHGKSNPRPGKMYIFDRSGMCGQRIEVRSDVVDATSWELQETISIRVIRGGWVLYEKPNFKGDKIALDEGDMELTCPFAPPEEEQQNGQPDTEEQKPEENGEAPDEQTKPARRFIIGSLRRAVRDYSVPEISLFPEEDAEGKKVVFRDSSDDARIFGFPIKATSIIIKAGLWLVYAKPFFEGPPCVLEVGGYSNPQAWGVDHPYVGSLHPLKIGEPRVENRSEPKMVVYEKPYFSGKSRTINTNMRDFMTRADRQQTAFMHNVGSLKVLGGIWVGYEKEGFRGHQYLLEEGEYHDWRVWGGCDAEMRSVRVIQADLTDPLMVMFEQPEEEEEGMEGDKTFEVTEAIPDVELFDYKTSTRSIEVLRGAWIAYSHVDFSGHQYILEKGFYNNSADWGAPDTHICSVQPILLAPTDITKSNNEIILYSEPDFQGLCHIFDCNEDCVSDKFLTKSCRVASGSWVLYEEKGFSGNMYVLSEGEYPSLASMGCPPGKPIRSVKVVPLTFSVPSISLFGLEGLEGREITTETEVASMVGEGFSNHVLSVRVNSGSWVICEHNNYRGRQFFLGRIEITNWPKFSSMQTIGSMFPIKMRRHFFRIKNTESQHYMSVQGGVGETKSGRVVVSPEVEPMSDIWYYQNGFIKNKVSLDMSLQVMGNVEPGAKVVLWSETRHPLQTWTAQMKGCIVSFTFHGMVLDVKGGKAYDKDHLVVMPENDERPSQQWEIELL